MMSSDRCGIQVGAQRNGNPSIAAGCDLILGYHLPDTVLPGPGLNGALPRYAKQSRLTAVLAAAASYHDPSCSANESSPKR